MFVFSLYDPEYCAKHVYVNVKTLTNAYEMFLTSYQTDMFDLFCKLIDNADPSTVNDIVKNTLIDIKIESGKYDLVKFINYPQFIINDVFDRIRKHPFVNIEEIIFGKMRTVNFKPPEYQQIEDQLKPVNQLAVIRNFGDNCYYMNSGDILFIVKLIDGIYTFVGKISNKYSHMIVTNDDIKKAKSYGLFIGDIIQPRCKITVVPATNYVKKVYGSQCYITSLRSSPDKRFVVEFSEGDPQLVGKVDRSGTANLPLTIEDIMEFKKLGIITK